MSSVDHSTLNSQIKYDLRMGIVTGFVLTISLLAALFSFVIIMTSYDQIDLTFGAVVIVFVVSVVSSKISYSKQSGFIVNTRLKTFSKIYNVYTELDKYLQTNNQGKKNKSINKTERLIDRIELWINDDVPKAFTSEIPQSIVKHLQERIIPNIENANIESNATKESIQKLRNIFYDLADKMTTSEPTLQDWEEFNTEIGKYSKVIISGSKKQIISLSKLFMILLAGGPITAYVINPILVEKGTSEGDALLGSILIALAWMAVIGPFILYFSKKN